MWFIQVSLYIEFGNKIFLIDILIIVERPESSISAICRTRTSLIIYKNLIEMREWMLKDFKKKIC